MSRWGGPADDYIINRLVGPQGEHYLLGDTSSYGAGSVDMLALRCSAHGVVQWTRTWGGTGIEYQEGSCVDLADAALYVSGASTSFGTSDAVLVKLALASGNLHWAYTWDSGSQDQVSSVTQDSARNVYLAGGSNGQGGAEDVLLIQLPPSSGGNPPGGPLRVRTWGTPSSEESVNGAQIDGSSGTDVLVVAGNVDSGQRDALVQKFDALLGVLWSRGFGGALHDDGHGLFVDGAGNVYVTGETESFGAGGTDVLIVKLDPQGGFLWARAWGGSGDENCGYLTSDVHGNLYLSGETDSFGASEGLVLAVSPQGQVLWSMTFAASTIGALALPPVVPLSGTFLGAGFTDSNTPALQACTGTTTILPNALYSLPGNTVPLAGTFAAPAGAQSTAPVSGSGGQVDVVLASLSWGCSATYCMAKVNSLGCTPAISSVGLPSASATNGFVVSGSNVRNNKSGLLLYGTSGAAALPFSGGTLCVQPPVKRSQGLAAGGTPAPAQDCSGVFTIDMNAFAHQSGPPVPPPVLLVPGTQVNVQFWGRDQGFAPPNNTTLTDGLQYVVWP